MLGLPGASSRLRLHGGARFVQALVIDVNTAQIAVQFCCHGVDQQAGLQQFNGLLLVAKKLVMNLRHTVADERFGGQDLQQVL